MLLAAVILMHQTTFENLSVTTRSSPLLPRVVGRAWPSSVWPELSSARGVQGRDPEFREQQIEGNSVPNRLGFQ